MDNKMRGKKPKTWSAGQVAVFVVLVLIGLYLRQRSMPEKLGVWEGGQIHNGQVYEIRGMSIQAAPGSRSVYVRPAAGGKPHLLAQTPNSPAPWEPLKIGDTAVYYLEMRSMTPPPPPPAGARPSGRSGPMSLGAPGTGGSQVGGGPGRGAPYGPGHPGDEHRPGGPPMPGRTAGNTDQRLRRPIGGSMPPEAGFARFGPEYALMSIPLKGGVPRSLGIVRGMATFTDNFVYWMEAGRDEFVTVAHGNLRMLEVHGHSRLMATSLADGATHPVASDLAAFTFVRGGGHEIFWSSAGPAPQPAADLKMLRERDSSPTVIHGIPGDAVSKQLPVLFENRVYWLEPDNDVAPGANIVQSKLMCAAVDGSNRGIVLKAPIGFMTVYRGVFYVIVAKGDSTSMGMSLARLHPEGSQPMEVLRSLPPNSSMFQFDEHYLYFVVEEEQRGLIDWLSDDQTRVERSRHLFRIPLPG